MKHFKKFFALMLSVIMVLGMSTTAFAEYSYSIEAVNEDTLKLTISDMENGHEYRLYPVAFGTATEGTKMTYAGFSEWGSALNETWQSLCSDEDILNDINQMYDDRNIIELIQEYVTIEGNDDYTVFQKQEGQTSQTMEERAGYYVLVDYDMASQSIVSQSFMRMTVYVQDGGGDTPTTTTKYTITAPSNGHSYAVYQIFTGDVYTEGETTYLSNLKWGANSTGTEGTAVDSSIQSAIAALSNEKEVVDKVSSYKSDAAASWTLNADNLTQEVPGGYYLIVDLGADTGTTEAYSSTIIEVVKDLTIEPKVDAPTIEKYVKETNDSTGVVSDWQAYADYDNGDTIPFQLKTTVVDNYDAYETYNLTFHDKMDSGLTMDTNSVNVYVDDGKIANSLYSLNSAPADKDSFDLTIDLKQTGAKAGSVIRVEYNATLNDKNASTICYVNEAHLTYSNNPNDSASTTNTPGSKACVYTFSMSVNKTDGANALKGAMFKLLKYNAKTSAYDIEVLPDGVTADDLTKASDVSAFTFYGLDTGKYRLVETHTPDGYNSIDDVDFEITADLSTNALQQVATSLTATASANDNATFSYNRTSNNGFIKQIKATVVNQRGVVLPSTGGIGTTIFYVTGTVLMAGAAAILVYRKKKNAAE